MMGFTTPCFIRKNTPELRKKLEDIGHVRYPYEFADWDDDRPDRKYIIIDVLYYTYGTKPTRKPKKGGDFIDCDDNEELFLALAALRDDTDKNQWIIDEANECFGYDDSWMICDRNNMNDRSIYTHYRKDTKEEIIERFKK